MLCESLTKCRWWQHCHCACRVNSVRRNSYIREGPHILLNRALLRLNPALLGRSWSRVLSYGLDNNTGHFSCHSLPDFVDKHNPIMHSTDGNRLLLDCVGRSPSCLLAQQVAWSPARWIAVVQDGDIFYLSFCQISFSTELYFCSWVDFRVSMVRV